MWVARPLKNSDGGLDTPLKRMGDTRLREIGISL
jgi:hypothetical protein